MLKKMLSSAAKASTRVGASVSGKLNTAKHLMHNQTNSMLNKIMHSSQTFKMNTKAGLSMWGDDILSAPSRYNKSANVHKAYHNVKPLNHSRKFQLGVAAVGAAGMTAISVMNGAMSAASDNLTARYMQDSRYSSKLLQHRVGNAAGSGKLNLGNHTGLSLALSNTRHG